MLRYHVGKLFISSFIERLRCLVRQRAARRGRWSPCSGLLFRHAAGVL